MTRFIPLIALALAATPALAAELSLKEAVDQAVSEHPDAQQGRLLADQAAASVRSAQAAFDPSLTASTTWSSTESAMYLGASLVDSDSESLDNSIAIQGILPTGTTWSVSTALDNEKTSVVQGGLDSASSFENWTGGAELRVTQDLLAPMRASDAAILSRQARERLSQAELTAGLRTDAAVADAANAWWSWKSAVDAVALSERSVEQALELEARTTTWFEEGEAARLEVDRVVADRLGAQRDLLRSQADARRAADALLVKLGEPVGTPIEPDGEVHLWTVPELTEAQIVELAVQNNPELALARLELDAAMAAERDARRSVLPSLDASVSLGTTSLSDAPSTALSDLWDADGMPRATVGLTLGVPLGGRAAAASTSNAATQVLIEEVQLRNAEAQLRADVRAAVEGVDTARQGVDLAEARLDVARATEAGEQARVDEGVRRLDQLLDAVQQREAAEVELLRARIELGQAELQVADLLGTAVRTP